jgi:tetratricopeptide (TPR) repeat protein
MTRTRLLLTLLGLVLCAAGAWSGWRLFASAEQRPEYAEAPFTPLGPEGFPLLPLKESTRAEQVLRVKYLRQDGAIARVLPREREAILAGYDNKFVKAREAAEEVLAATPDSVPARFALAMVLHEGERNLPKALHAARLCRRALERHGQTHPDDADAREWYILTLQLEAEILGYMDVREEQLQALAQLEKVYRPMPWLRIFPLIKLNRLDEAEQLVELVASQGTWKLKVLNSRCMLAEQRRDRAECYRAGKTMVETINDSAVLWSNFGLSCQYDFRINEAEAAYIRSAFSRSQDFNGSAFFSLASLYTQQSRLPEAWHALLQGHRQRARRNGHTLEQDQSVADGTTADVLLALGRSADAERFARKVYERPGRTGSNTGNERTESLLSGLTLWSALRSRCAALREEEALARFPLRAEASRRQLEVETWTLERRLLKLLSENPMLDELSRPYLPGDGFLPSWQIGTLMRLLPAGVAEEALRQARVKEQSREGAGGAAPYLDALEAELALSRGQNERALALARKALGALPPLGEQLLRGRVAALGAEAARQLGQDDEALQLANQAMGEFPQAFRMLETAIPVRIEHDNSSVAAALAAKLRHSPRLRIDPNGLVIRLGCQGEDVVMEMYRLQEVLHFNAKVPTKGAADEVVEAAFHTFHERMMAPKLELKATDVTALEGTEAARQPANGDVVKSRKDP